MNRDSEKWHRVVTIQVWGVDIDWEKDHDCSVEINSMRSIVIAKASQVRDYLNLVGLLKNFQVRFRMNQNDGLIVILILRQNEDLFGFENNLKIIQEELHRRFVECRNAIQEKYNSAGVNQPPVPTPANTKSNYAEEEAFLKLQSGSTGSKMEITFGSRKENVDSQISPPIASWFIDEDATEVVTGDVLQFNEEHQKVTLYNISGMQGYVTLDVENISQRKKLIMAKLEHRQVVVKFAPLRHSVRPDKQPRSGRLTDIESVGDSNEKLL